MGVRAPIGHNIRRRRKALGFTQAALAREAGISAAYLNLIEADKRAIGGSLLRKIAALLEVEIGALDGRAEQQMIDELREVATEPVLRGVQPSAGAAAALVGRHPDWARAMLALHRAYRDQTQNVAALANRLSQDPVLADAMHRMLTHTTAIRSAAEIVEDGAALAPEMQDRFLRIIAAESARLSETAQTLTTFFDESNTRMRALTPADEVEDLLIARGNYFAKLEAAADTLCSEIERRCGPGEGRWAEFLDRAFGIRVETVPSAGAGSGFRNQCRYDAGTRTLAFLENAGATTRRFQMARLAADRAIGAEIAAEADEAMLSTPTARALAGRALASYAAGAMIFPYAPYLDAALKARFDLEVLRQRYAASFEQAGHRLVTLRRPGAEGVPFAFMRTDPAGHITKRFPLRRLALPRHGHACPLWAAYLCYQTPDRIVRQLVEFSDGGRFVMIARTVTKQPAMFHEMPVLHAVMLACDALDADRTVYGDGLDLGRSDMATPVGPACRYCARADCRHRGEAAILENRGGDGIE
ncbi:MAG: DUF2083 domain-containing protein [Rhodospirillaceae bacterium]|nr:DUF2083 domain-containing protein [Rhodospirillaceae bacterium]